MLPINWLERQIVPINGLYRYSDNTCSGLVRITVAPDSLGYGHLSSRIRVFTFCGDSQLPTVFGQFEMIAGSVIPGEGIMCHPYLPKRSFTFWLYGAVDGWFAHVQTFENDGRLLRIVGYKEV